MSDMIETTGLMTAKEYLVAQGLPAYSELVKGKVVDMNQPSPRHGRVCFRVAFTLGKHVEKHDCGHIMTNDSGIQTSESPDTIRGADVAFCSYARMPRGEVPDDYSGPPPEVVFEVVSKSDRWSKIYTKIAEYFDIDVQVVVVVDPQRRNVQVFRPDGNNTTLSENQTLELPEIQPTFQTAVSEFFV